MFDEEYRDEHDECRHEIELLNQRIDRLVSAFKQCRADLALSSGTWSNAASFGLQPEDIGLKRIDEDSPTQETSPAPELEPIHVAGPGTPIIGHRVKGSRCSCNDFPGADEFCTAHSTANRRNEHG